MKYTEWTIMNYNDNKKIVGPNGTPLILKAGICWIKYI